MARVCVMGAGVLGLACGWALARRGVAVRVVDRARPGAGSSGGHVGALAPHVPEMWNPKKAFQLESLLMAEAWWGAVAAAGGGDPGYARGGRVQPLEDDAAVARAQGRAAGAADLWQGRAVWRVVGAADLRAQAGLLPASPSGRYIHDTLSARIAPRAAVAALVAAIRARGGTVCADADAADLPGQGDAGPVIWATGAPGLAALGRDLGHTVGQGIKGQSALLSYPAPGAAQVFAGGLHIVPHGDGTVAIGSTTEREFADLGTDDQLEALIDKARQICPALGAAPVLDRWAGARPRARSRAPMLGLWPGRPGHVVVNGGFKIGLGMAPKIAEVIADLLLEGVDAIPPGFRVEDSLPAG